MQLAYLHSNAEPFILNAHVELYEAYSVTSTNDWAWEYYETLPSRSQCLQLSCLFVAHSQQAGRGTHQRIWASPPGTGLYASLLSTFQKKGAAFSKPYSAASLQSNYARVAALAIQMQLLHMYPALSGKLGIRHINDLCIGHAKLGGVLVEAKMGATGPPRAIVTGVGLNIYPDDARQLADNRNTPISLFEALPAEDKLTLPTPVTMAYLLGKAIAGVYAMYHQGILNDDALSMEQPLTS